MLQLGSDYNLALCWAPVDLDTANGATGLRISMRDYESVDFVFIKGVGNAGDDPDLDVQQHTAYTAGTTKDLDVVTEFYYQQEATLDGDEGWSKGTQTAASEVDLGADCAELQGLYVVHVEASQLSDGYYWVSINCAVTTAVAQLGTCIAILNRPKYGASPENLLQVLNNA
jgi:hypothetical protein